MLSMINDDSIQKQVRQQPKLALVPSHRPLTQNMLPTAPPAAAAAALPLPPSQVAVAAFGVG